MDEIQKALVKAGRKDLAQKYYEKTAAMDSAKTAKLLESVALDPITSLEQDIRMLKKKVESIVSYWKNEFKEAKDDKALERDYKQAKHEVVLMYKKRKLDKIFKDTVDGRTLFKVR